MFFEQAVFSKLNTKNPNLRTACSLKMRGVVLPFPVKQSQGIRRAVVRTFLTKTNRLNAQA
jgi:hypothetical protein